MTNVDDEVETPTDPEECSICNKGKRILVNGLYLCPTCDFVKVKDDGRLVANPPKEK